jgi:Domain of unknown function (DUF3127)
MQVIGKVVEILPLQTGEGKNGAWKKQDVIIETQVQYPKKICIGLWNDKIKSSFLEIGNDHQIDVDIESKFYKGRWYTEVKAWRVTLLLGGTPSITDGIDSMIQQIDDPPF